ncbi:hypothetical protein TRAPUB_3642, partial [Trametes pubescens]
DDPWPASATPPSTPGDSTKLKAALVSQITRVLSAEQASGVAGVKVDGRAEASGLERKTRWEGAPAEGRKAEGESAVAAAVKATVCKASKLYIGEGDTLLSPLTVSVPSGSAPDAPTFLYLHQENLVVSMDAHCPRAVERRISLQPGLSMLMVNTKLIDMFQQLERYSETFCKATDGLFKEMRKRKKHTDADNGETLPGPVNETDVGSEGGNSASKRRKL